MRPATSAIALALAFGAFTGQAQSQALTFEVEGEIMDAVPSGTGFKVKVMGTEINVPSTLPITTPTTSMSASQFFGEYKNRDLPGIGGGKGFIGGTAIVIGTQTGNIIDAESFFTDYHENVVLGGVTAPPENDPTGLYVSGMKILPLPQAGQPGADDRYPGLPFQNEYGFKLKPEIPVGALAAVEGYMDDSGAMRAFLVESDQGELVNATSREVSILRAQCRQRSLTSIELSVSGGAHGLQDNGLPNTRVTIAPDANQPAWVATAPTAALTVDGENPMYYLYSYSFKGTPSARRGCPTKVLVTMPSGITAPATVSAVGETDLRVD
jgi:hypothetical protein